MVVFGGADSTGGNFESSVWLLHLTDGRWSRKQPSQSPPGRHFHSCVMYERSLWVFGGLGSGILQDLWKYNLDTDAWTLMSTLGDAPTPR